MAAKKKQVADKPELLELPAMFLPVPVSADGKSNDEPVSPKNAFIALSLSIMREHFMSGDTKYFLFLGMKHNLEKMGYSEDAVEEFLLTMDKARKVYTTKNDFMG